MARQHEVVEAVTLSLFLTDSRRRRLLFRACATDDGDDGPEVDQRRRTDLDRLTRCLSDLPASLRSQAAGCRAEAARLLDTADVAHVSAVIWPDPLYPSRLSAIDDPPAVLWVSGDVAVLNRRAVAIVGSRSASRYALMVAEQLGSDLAGRGVAVVSGLARGVDAAAHRGALMTTGLTAAVLGSGVDVVYPREHGALMASIARRGAVVSEWGPGVPPLAYHFPLRNRLISGLCVAVVVVEATSRSGSLITARWAAEQGRDVMAVPGNVLSGRNRGAHALLRDGARIVETADDVLEELGECAESAAPHARQEPGRAATAVVGPGSQNDRILAQMDPGEACDIEAIVVRTGVGRKELLVRMTELELAGQVERIGPGRFVRAWREVVT